MNDLTQLSNEQLMQLYQQSQRGTVTVRTNTQGDNANPFAQMSDEQLLAEYNKTKQQPQQQQKPQVGAVEDSLKTVLPALARGASYVAATSRDLTDLGAAGIRKLGLPQVSEDAFRAVMRASSPSSVGPSSGEMQQALETVTGPLYKPQTTAGQYVNAIGELAPAAAAGPGNFLRNILGLAVVPGIGGEALIDVTKSRGTAAEPWMRAAGQITGGIGGAYASAPRGPKTIANATQGVTDQQFKQAEQLFQEAMQAGVPISRAEAVQHVTGPNRLGDIQRVVEGQGRMRDFYSPRVQNNEAAFGRMVDQVQPTPTPNPSNIGPEVSQASQETVTGVRNIINNASEPFYTAAAQDRISPQMMAKVRAAPGYQEAVNAIKGDPQLARYVAGLPEDSVAFINELKKYVDNQATNAAGPMNAQRNQQRAAGYSQDAQLFRDAGVQASQNYEAALAIQEQSRKKYLDPLLNGPLGKLAKDDLGTQQAISALFPTNPLPNSAGEITTAVSALAKRNPRAAQDLVRAHMGSVFNEATQRLQGGLNQYSGAGFAAVIRGNPQQAANLEAAIRALPNGDRVWPGVNKFLDFMEAQGQRQRPGSQTSFNTEFMNELKGSGSIGDAVVQGTKSGLVKLPERLNNMLQTWRLGQNVDSLARLFTDPRAGKEFMRLAQLPTGSSQAIGVLSRLAYMSQFNTGVSQPKN